MNAKQLEAFQNELVFAADRLDGKPDDRYPMLRLMLIQTARDLGKIRVVLKEGEEI